MDLSLFEIVTAWFKAFKKKYIKINFFIFLKLFLI
jgi:hypothetical protein